MVKLFSSRWSLVAIGLILIGGVAAACVMPTPVPAPVPEQGTEVPAAGVVAETVQEVGETPAQPAAELEGTQWQLLTVRDADGQQVMAVPDSEATALFQAGRVGGNTGCNNYGGTYTLDGNKLTVGNIVSTMMACPEPLMKQEQAVLVALVNTATYETVGNQLHLFDDAGEILAAFEPQVQTPLTGTTWQALNYNNGKQAVVSVLAGTELTVTFGDNGQVSGSAGCNNFAGSYQVDGDKITIGPLASTRKLCAEPEGIMEQEMQYLQALPTAATYAIAGDQLELRTADGALVAFFTAMAPAQEAGVPAAGGTVEMITLYVGPNQVPCVGVAPMMCLQVKEKPEDEYKLFYSTIQGFEYEPGYEYELKVQRETVDNPPADASKFRYTLVEEVSKTPVEPATELEGTRWQLIGLADAYGGLTVSVPGSEATALFQDGTVSGNASCNNYSGSYTLDGDSLTILLGPMTLMACPEPLMKQEQAFTAALGNTATYQIVGNQLHLFDGAGAILAAFEPQVQTPLTGTTWQALNYNNGKQAVVSVLTGTELTATFGDNGQVSGSAGCNNFAGAYQVDGDAIAIGPLAATMKMCIEPEGIMEQEMAYLQALPTAATYAIAGDQLELRTAEGALVASYTAMAPAPAQAETTPGTPNAAMMDTLANLTYINVSGMGTDTATSVITTPIQLTNGVYTATVGPEGASPLKVQVTNYVATGELNGQPAAAVILASNFGGSGVFVDLAVVVQQDGQWVNVDTTLLGDRVVINSLEIVDNQIVVDMTTQGPNDPMCCPTQQVINTYELRDGELVLVNTTLGGTVEPSVAQPEITGVVWQWIGTAYGDGNSLTVDESSKYTLLLLPDGSVKSQVDCNKGGGTYALDGSQLTMSVVVLTRMICPPGSQSEAFIKDLNAAASYVMDGPDLIINLAMDGGNMAFSPAPAETGAAQAAAPAATETAPALPEMTTPDLTEVTGATWQWVAFTDPVNGAQQIASPAKYTMTLQPSGTIRLQADCNKGGGTYKVDGASVTFDVATLTRAMCGPGSQGAKFVQYLNDARVWFMQDGDLFLDLLADAGTMRFSKAQ